MSRRGRRDDAMMTIVLENDDDDDESNRRRSIDLASGTRSPNVRVILDITT
jgi:hypothetical protein